MVTNNNGVVATNDLRATSYWWVSTIRRSASFNYISFNSFVIFIFFVFLYSIQFMLVYMESMRGVLYLILNLNRDKKKVVKSMWMGPLKLGIVLLHLILPYFTRLHHLYTCMHWLSCKINKLGHS